MIYTTTLKFKHSRVPDLNYKIQKQKKQKTNKKNKAMFSEIKVNIL